MIGVNAEDEALRLLRARHVQLFHEALRQHVVDTRLSIYGTENDPRIERQELGRIRMVVAIERTAHAHPMAIA